MVEVQKGAWLQDRDPRKAGRKVQVVGVGTNAKGEKYAIWQSSRRFNKIKLSRIATDVSKARNNGWLLLGATPA